MKLAHYTNKNDNTEFLVILDSDFVEDYATDGYDADVLIDIGIGSVILPTDRIIEVKSCTK